jgi:hypothetical protein
MPPKKTKFVNINAQNCEAPLLPGIILIVGFVIVNSFKVFVIRNVLRIICDFAEIRVNFDWLDCIKLICIQETVGVGLL